MFRTLGDAGLLGLPFGEDVGGGGQPYEVYLQVVEELAARWASVALGVSVHTLSCYPIDQFGTEAQRRDLLPDMVGGQLLGAYCLSEAHAGSDPAAMRASARTSDDGWLASGEKAWVTHGGHADFYSTFLRTPDDGERGISCFHLTPDLPGFSAARPEEKMGLTGSTTAAIRSTTSRCPPIGSSGSAAAASRSPSPPSTPAPRRQRRRGGARAVRPRRRRPVRRERRPSAGRSSSTRAWPSCWPTWPPPSSPPARCTWWRPAARTPARPYSRQASIAKLVSTDAAMKVTTDAVQVLGGAGYTREFPVERYMREAKVMQIFEGTNQIQRMVIGKALAREAAQPGRGR